MKRFSRRTDHLDEVSIWPCVKSKEQVEVPFLLVYLRSGLDECA